MDCKLTKAAPEFFYSNLCDAAVGRCTEKIWKVLGLSMGRYLKKDWWDDWWCLTTCVVWWIKKDSWSLMTPKDPWCLMSQKTPSIWMMTQECKDIWWLKSNILWPTTSLTMLFDCLKQIDFVWSLKKEMWYSLMIWKIYAALWYF